ncbi:D-glutamate cyclase family protein [Streptomyces sp. TP-A0874]|uniref:D-glutamate cyclase family protein n=1 Tax=Streptomyces sp. TP-A0874 TaxID=549819 RepID=UPI0035B535F1
MAVFDPICSVFSDRSGSPCTTCTACGGPGAAPPGDIERRRPGVELQHRRPRTHATGVAVQGRDRPDPMFRACGATAQRMVRDNALPFAVTRMAGHVFVTHLRAGELAA